MSKIKICGLTREEDIEAVNAACPDFCGFVIEFPKSSRCVSSGRLRELVKGLEQSIIPVGVFVDAPMELPLRLLEEGTIGVAQLHGHEDEEYVRELHRRIDKPVIKAFSVKTGDDIKRACESSADYILLDQGNGGTGKTFDWGLVPEIERPFFLAGGLGMDNLELAIRQVKPWAVDLSSSLEIEGKKDPDRISKAVEIVRKFT
ncbi:MAG: phosphoribosylanthranilate isomerase [Clostridia bacterium]|nr:phosphoribosylanthranilate isomerase [Clostridia bacterium]NCC44342.1 phosphoribosylanthranilate isomerase [Clostridia bacterium]